MQANFTLVAAFGYCLLLAGRPTSASCPNLCSGHGSCSSTLTCTCYAGWKGADCSIRQCASASPWFAEETGTDSLHSQSVECAGVGTCDEATGLCMCQLGFAGRACERLDCNQRCNGHGACISIAEAASTQDDVNLFVTTTYSLWDADRSYGCVCDVGYTGYDCSLRTCVSGHDPLHDIATTKYDEIQAFDCTGTSGTFKLKFRGQITAAISYSAIPTTASESGVAAGTGVGESLESKLEALSTVSDVTVSVTSSSSGAICDSDGATFKVTFTHDHGDLPTMAILQSSVSSLAFNSGGSVTGTKQNLECNNRGACDRNSGECTCYTGFSSSDGTGSNVAGSTGDCGYTGGITNCEGAVVCNGHGTCSGSTAYQCACFEGWQGGYCEHRKCPFGIAWWDEPTATNTAHARAECSNRGTCDRSSGQCQCMEGFTGAACERTKCPEVDSLGCGGNGVCLSLAQAARLRMSNGIAAAGSYGATAGTAATWDAHKVYGCKCLDHRYPEYGAGFTGHDCSQRTCPYGDNPSTASQVDEVQQLTCTGDGGYFTLTFRGYTTDRIYHNAAAVNDYVQVATATITYGSATLSSVSVDLTTQLSQNDVVQLYSSTHSDTRNFTVSSVTTTTVVLTEPVGMETETTVPLRKVVKSVKSALQELPTIRNVSVAYGSGAVACSTAGVAVSVTFLGDFGDLPDMTYSTSALTNSGGSASIAISTPTTGTKDEMECSGQGLCDRAKGICKCFDSRVSSNGQGARGTRGDCGFREV